MDILSYLLRDKTVYQHITNLELLPLCNDKFLKFEALSTTYCYVCSKNIPPTLLPNLKNRLVYINDRKVLHDQLTDLAETELTQLRVIDVQAVAKLVPLSDPSTWSQKDLERFWDWLQNKALDHFKGLKIVPLSASKTASLCKTNKVVYVPSNNQCIKNASLVQALTKFGIQFVRNSQFNYVRHSKLSYHLCHLEPSDIYDALASAEKYLTSTKLQKKEATSVQSFLSRHAFHTESQIKILCQLPIFNFQSYKMVNVTTPSCHSRAPIIWLLQKEVITYLRRCFFLLAAWSCLKKEMSKI